jgi:hypothetical protein
MPEQSKVEACLDAVEAEFPGSAVILIVIDCATAEFVASTNLSRKAAAEFLIHAAEHARDDA